MNLNFTEINDLNNQDQFDMNYWKRQIHRLNQQKRSSVMMIF